MISEDPRNYSIGFDIDGVVCNSYDFIRKEILDKFNYDIIKSKESDYYIKVPGYSIDEIHDHITEAFTEKGIEFPIYKDASNYLYKFEAATEKPIHFITARLPDANVMTVNWLCKSFPKLKFRLYHTKYGEKHTLQRDYDVFVDDHIDNFHEDFLCGNKLGFLMLQPYNEHKVKNGQSKELIVIQNLEDMYRHLEYHLIQ